MTRVPVLLLMALFAKAASTVACGTNKFDARVGRGVGFCPLMYDSCGSCVGAPSKVYVTTLGVLIAVI